MAVCSFRNPTCHTYRATYWDIVANQRIVYTYEMPLDETRVSISLATIELEAEAGRTLLVLTEHGLLRRARLRGRACLRAEERRFHNTKARGAPSPTLT